MTVSGTIQKVASVGGISIQSTLTRNAASQIGHDWNLNAAVAGNLTTRTSDTIGTITSVSHGYANSDVVDVHWLNGTTPQCAYGGVVSSAAANTFVVTVAGGDVLPAQDSAVNAYEVDLKDTDVDGDLIEVISIKASVAAHITFRDSGANVLLVQTLVGNEGWDWASNQGIANPLTGNAIADVRISSGDATNTGNLQMGLVYNSE
jgi:hypothetical protein